MKTLTVGIPVFNEIKYIDATINNICEISKNVSYQVEILIIDNCSFDGTRNYLETLRIDLTNVRLKVIYNTKNEGFNYSYDQLVKNATGTYVWIIGGQDLIYSQGLKALEELWDLNYDYLICNARIKDERLDKIINESLWGSIKEQSFSTIENFFEVLGGPCQAVSCNIIKTEFLRPQLGNSIESPLWGYIERLIDALIYNRHDLRIKFVNTALVEMLIEEHGWQSKIQYAKFTPTIEISEVYKKKFRGQKKILNKAAPFRDVFGITRTFIEARVLDQCLSLELFNRLRIIFGHKLSFWFFALPILASPKPVAKCLVKTKPLVHMLRRVFKVRSF